MNHKVYITSEVQIRGLFGVKSLIKKAVFAVLSAESITVPCEVSVLLIDDEGIRALNRNFRKQDKPTDVLSFPSGEHCSPLQRDVANTVCNHKSHNTHVGANSVRPRPRCFLGDMAISLERAKAQGDEFGHGAKREIQYLTVHSILHLLGYDHEDEGEEKKLMRTREKEIMAGLGVKDGTEK